MRILRPLVAPSFDAFKVLPRGRFETNFAINRLDRPVRDLISLFADYMKKDGLFQRQGVQRALFIRAATTHDVEIVEYIVSAFLLNDLKAILYESMNDKIFFASKR